VQKVITDIPWEILVIDNASTDNTAEVAQSQWPVNSLTPLRIVREPQLGIGNARYRSFSEARYEIISFIDDDNWVRADWINNVADFFQQHPKASAVGGPSRAVFAGTPPKWFSGVSSFYAIGVQHARAGDITDEPGTLLWTAGMSLRKEKALELVRKGFHFYACGGSSLPLKTGEDTELCFALRAGGGRLYYEPKLEIEHYMPPERLTWPKALRLMRTMGNASVLLDLYQIALGTSHFATRPAWKNSWLFYELKALRHLALLVLSHPLDCLSKPEGSGSAVEFEKTMGQLSTLWALRGRYNKMQEEIRHSTWARERSTPD
jgi:cellulose synthase/poly-beta-1,6-N-acetylglucosamine synthase-like glycosyltransferase